METSIVPGIYDPHLADRMIYARPDDAHEMARRLAQEEGLFVGYSAGAAAWAAIELAKTLTQDSVIITVFPDGGEKYLSIAR
jgi:cysteine synthase B